MTQQLERATTIEELNVVADAARDWYQYLKERAPRHRSGPLRMDTLGDCIAALEAYRGVLNRIDTALTVFEQHPEVVAFVESLRDGYPLQVGALHKALAGPSPAVQDEWNRSQIGGFGPEKRRGSGWGST